MTFMRKFNTILHKSNDKIFMIDSEDGINLSNFDMNFKLLSSRQIEGGSFSFIDYWFDLTPDDKIYGIINNKKNSLLFYRITDKYIIKNVLLKYNPDKVFLKFVYAKQINLFTHILYYEIDKLNPYNVKLIHLYKNNLTWNKYVVDSFSYNVLTNFLVTYDNDFSPYIFYYKLVNGFEELFVSIFDTSSCIWSDPQKLTNSKKPKIYLSAIKDSKNHYHIIYSENNFNKYYCTYIHGYFDDGDFKQLNNFKLSDTVACTFPNVIEYNDTIYAHWVEYHNLYVSISPDGGYTWDKVSISGASSALPFTCCNYHDNNNKHGTFNYFTLYMVDASEKILGLD